MGVCSWPPPPPRRGPPHKHGEKAPVSIMASRRATKLDGAAWLAGMLAAEFMAWPFNGLIYATLGLFFFSLAWLLLCDIGADMGHE